MSNANPLVSVIVPVYNVEAFLAACLNSILVQTFATLEVIVVDDGSTDGCPALCDAYATSDHRVVVVHQANAGLSAARNAGLDVARGDYLAFIDSDDVIAPRFVEDLLAAMGTESDIAQCPFTQDEPIFCAQTGHAGETLDRRAYAEAMLNDATGAFTVVWNKLYRASLFEDVRFPVGRQHEDEFVTYRVAWQARSVALVPQAMYYYRQRAGSTMATGFSARSLDAIDALEQRVAFYREQGEERLAVLAEAVLCHRMRAMLPKVKAELPERATAFSRQMHGAYGHVLSSSKVPFKKKITLTLQMMSPELYSLMRKLRS